MEEFFSKIEEHYLNEKPFVAYKKPNDGIVNAIMQSDTVLNYTTDYSESGFVFAPFDNKEKSILIPFEICIEAEFKQIDLPETPDEFELIFSDKQQHIQLVNKGIAAVKNGHLKKVVLSREEQHILQTQNPIALFKKALQNYSSAFVYLWYHSKIGCWLGATPEVLLKTRNKQFKTMALAGTQVFSNNLIWESKEQEEQQIVTDYITNNLKLENIKFVAEKPYTIKAGHLAHLRTDISGSLNSSNAKSLQSLIEILHPTPAVCGFPKELAKAFILDHENYNRTFYTGFLGELNKEIKRKNNRRNTENNAYRFNTKTSDLYVNLRCMQLKNNLALIYVGGGITASSNSEKEFIETCNKTKTMKKLINS